MKFTVTPLALAFVLATPSAACADPEPTQTSSVQVPETAAEIARQKIAQSNIAGIGIARIEDGKVAWSGYWGEQSPGVPVSEQTAFNAASVAKTLIAETVLRLSDQGQMSLDDPISDHFEHTDLSLDPRYASLTPRILLSHQAALLNWPWLYDDDKLAFTADPGLGEINYSGAGIEIVMRYLEARFEKSYPDLVKEVLLDPLGIEEIAVNREPWLEGRVSNPVNRDGTIFAPFNRSGNDNFIQIGDYTAADNMYATVPGYAQLLIALIEGAGLSAAMQAERATLHSASDSSSGDFCIAEPADCPDPIGYGIGWGLFGEPGRTILNHGGNDFAEHAQVYFIPETREGLVLFVNGGNAFPVGIEIIETIDPKLRMAKHFRALIERMRDGGG